MILMKLKNLYFLLAVISTLAAIQSMIFPRWPEASEIPSDKLNRYKSNVQINGAVIKSSLIKSEHSDFNLSHTPITSLSIQPNADLLLTNVQVRDRNNFSVSYMTDSIKSLRLNKSATLSKLPPFYLSEKSPTGATFQTCLVSGNSLPNNFGVGQEQLSLAVDQVKSFEQNIGIKRLLGLSPSRRYQCMLITLKTKLPYPESYQIWRDSLKQLQSIFK